jgi:hypothetical protein
MAVYITGHLLDKMVHRVLVARVAVAVVVVITLMEQQVDQA